MIEVTYANGTVNKMDLLPDEVSRACFVASVLTVAEMTRLFVSSQAKSVADELGLDTSGSETAVCKRIHDYFNAGGIVKGDNQASGNGNSDTKVGTKNITGVQLFSDDGIKGMRESLLVEYGISMGLDVSEKGRKADTQQLVLAKVAELRKSKD